MGLEKDTRHHIDGYGRVKLGGSKQWIIKVVGWNSETVDWSPTARRTRGIS